MQFTKIVVSTDSPSAASRVRSALRPVQSLRSLLFAALALLTLAQPAAADTLDDVLSVLSTAGVIDPAVVEAKPMIQCLLDGKSVEKCAEFAAGKAKGLIPNDPKIQKVVDIFKAVKAQEWLEVFLLAGQQVVCSLVPGGSVKDLFCGAVFDIAEPVITSAYVAVQDGDIVKLVSLVGVKYACGLLPNVSGANELCGVLGEIVEGIAKGVGAAVGALGNLAEDIAGQTQHMPVEQYYIEQWRSWLQYAVVKQLHSGQPAWLYAGMYGGTNCVEYFDSHKMSASNAGKVCGIMKQRFLQEIADTAKVYQVFPASFYAGWGEPRVAGWASAYYHQVEAFAGATENASLVANYLLKANPPFKDLWSQCNGHNPLQLPAIPGPNKGVHNADKVAMGTAISWACTRVGQLLADELEQWKAKIDSLNGLLSGIGCPRTTPLPALRHSCQTYAAFDKCSGVYPTDDSVTENLCQINRYSADPALAKNVVAKLGAKRCNTVAKSGQQGQLNVQCTRPWKQIKCKILVTDLSKGPPGQSGVACVSRVESGFIAGKAQVQALIKSMNTEPSGAGYLDPKTGTTQQMAVITGAKCQTAPEGQWDPLRVSCQDPGAQKEVKAKLPGCASDPNQDGADNPCYSGPLTREGADNQPVVLEPAVPLGPVNTRPIDVELSFYKRNGRQWSPDRAPAIGSMVAVRCVYTYEPRDPQRAVPAWSMGFVEGNREVLDKFVGPGLLDRASGKVTRTWYGTFLMSGPVELGCVTDVDGELAESTESDNRMVRTVEVPGRQRTGTARPTEKSRVTRTTALNAALARNAAPHADVQPADFVGIKRAKDSAQLRLAPAIRNATVGEPLVIDCSYVVAMDALNGAPVTLQPWHALIELGDQTVQTVKGDTDVVSVHGLSTPGRALARWTPAQPGEYAFRCRFDPDGTIEEVDESNNELTLPLTVSAASGRKR